MILDDSLLLIEPKTAAEFSAKLAAEAAERDAAAKAAAGGASAGGSTVLPGQQGSGPSSGGGSSSTATAGIGAATTTTTATPSVKKRMFYGTVELDPVKAKLQFSDVAEEVILLFAQRPEVTRPDVGGALHWHLSLRKMPRTRTTTAAVKEGIRLPSPAPGCP